MAMASAGNGGGGGGGGSSTAVGASASSSAGGTAGASDEPKSKVCCLRVVFVASMAVAAAVCGTTAYLAVRSLESDLGEQTYQSVAASALKGAQAIMRRKLQASAVLASQHEHAFPNASQWPYVAIPGYFDTAIYLTIMSNSTAFVVNTIIQPEEVTEFEAYAAQVFQSNGYPNETGMSEFGFGIWARDPSNPGGRIRDAGNTTYGGKNAILAPIFQVHHPAISSVVLFNSYSEEVRARAIDSAIDCVKAQTTNSSSTNFNWTSRTVTKPSCVVVTESVVLITTPGPASVLYWPITPKNNPNTVVAMVSTPIHWASTLTNVVPDYVDGLYCVISSKFKTETYIMKGGEPVHLGEGDLHDRTFDSYAKQEILNDVDTSAAESVVYTLTTYPSRELLEDFRSNSPVSISLGFVAVILFSAFLFFLYDFFMRHESQQRKTILEVKRRFVRFVSHEIRTPLNTVCLGLELLQAELDTKQSDRTIVNGSSASAIPSLVEEEKNGECAKAALREHEEKRRQWMRLTNEILENSTNAVNILNDLLAYDKIEQGTFKLEVGTVHIWELIRATVAAFRIQAEKRQISLTLAAAADSTLSTNAIAEGAANETQQSAAPDLERLHVVGDDTRLRQVIRNLISNSLKFSPEITGMISVTSTYNPDGLPKAAAPKAHILHKVATPKLDCIYPRAGSIVVRVKDNGVGMTQEQLGRLFQEGVQFDANKHQSGGGSGLGLMITKGLVEQHGGTIVIDSDGPGLGATATIELPLYEFPEAERAKAFVPKTAHGGGGLRPETEPRSDTANAASISLSAPRRTHHVLVVDDALPNRKMLVRLLERAGHVCLSACNGQEAISMFKSDQTKAEADSAHTPIDTILMDYEMPVLNGPDATKRLRDGGCKALVFGVTGNVLSEDIAYFKSMGANDVLAKPVQVSLLDEFWGRYE